MSKIPFLSSIALAFVASTAFAGTEVTQYNTRGAGADASLGTWDACRSQGAWLYASEYVSRQQGPAQEQGGLYMGYYAYDWCTGTSSWGWAQLGPESVSLNGVRGASANFTTDVVAYTWGYQCDQETWECWYTSEETVVPVSASLTWSPSGDVYRGMSVNRGSGPWGSSVSRGVGASTQATLSGSFVINGIAYDLANAYASLSQNNSGSLSITRYP